MEHYMEKQLYNLHTSGSRSKFKQKFLSFGLATLFVFLLPYLHIGIFYRMIWVPDKPPINRDTCACGCFDTIFRGRYENPPNAYKCMYFTATSNTLWIWLAVLLAMMRSKFRTL